MRRSVLSSRKSKRVVLAATIVPLMALSPINRPPDKGATVDPKAEALLNAAVRRIQKANTVSATNKVSRRDPKGSVSLEQTVSVVAEKPYRVRVEHTQRYKSGKPEKWVEGDLALSISNGERLWNYRGKDTVASARPVSKKSLTTVTHLMDGSLAPFLMAEDDHSIQQRVWLPSRSKDPTLRALVLDGRSTWNGETVEVVRWVKMQMQGAAPPGSNPPGLVKGQNEVFDTTRFYLSVGRDTVVRRIVSVSSNGAQEELIVNDLRLDAPIASDTMFAVSSALKLRDEEPEASPVGTQFPDFSVPAFGPGGDSTTETLKSVLAGKKAVLFWYWASH